MPPPARAPNERDARPTGHLPLLLVVVAGLAAMLGFESSGIEVQPELVYAAEELAEDFGLEVNFASGSFVPSGYVLPDRLRGGEVDHPWWDSPAGSGYEDLGLDPERIDLFFAYPWPGEGDRITAVFADCARPGALLLTYEDARGLRLRRKTGPGRTEELEEWAP